MSPTALLIIFALACVGLVISSLLPAGTPEGMRRVKCPRCGKTQNAIARNILWECCQCRLVSLTPRTPIERDKRIREEIRWGLLDD
jgi:ribosomal protein L37AE/L43A